MTGQTMSEKILARASHAESVHPGQIVDGDVDLLYMHEMLAMALMPFNEIGTMKVWDPEKIVVTLDHWVPPPTPEIAKMHQTIRDFCHKQGIRRFHDVGDHGIVHQLIAERGYAHPWDLVIGSDSHTNMVGAVGAFAAGIGATDTAAVMATGRLWLRVPETIRVEIRGKLAERTGAKDVILKVIGTTGDDGARYAAVEFTGPMVKALPMNERFVLCNMTTEMGAKVGMIEADSITKKYLAHAGVPFQPIDSDEDASFAKTFAFDVDGMGPQVACPSNPANLKPSRTSKGRRSMSRSSAPARTPESRIFESPRTSCGGRRWPPGCGSRSRPRPRSSTARHSRRASSRCSWRPPRGVGGRRGVHLLNESELSRPHGIAAGQVYLASPWTVAASAIRGKITDPRKV